MTEKVYEELDNAKAEIEKLRSEYRVKNELCDKLKRSYDDQVKRTQELNQKLEKQALEVESRTDENFALKQSLEDLKCKLKEKELTIKSYSSSNDKLRADFNSKLRESEEEKKELVSSLDEANVKILELERENRHLMDKIDVLKEGIVSVSQKKCASESKLAKASKQMREGGDMFDKLEEEKVKLEEQVKWKDERFKHLEEAHEKLRNNLCTKEKDWDMEKHVFFDEISTLETKLDSQSRLLEDFQRRLEMCSRSLAHEENQRKCLDKQLSESNSRFLEMKSKLERLINEREKDVEILKNLLGEKDSVCKEMEYKVSELEEQKQVLVSSLEELKESQIREATNSSSVAKLRNKLKTLKQIHNDCSRQSEVREAEWYSRFEKMVADLNFCRLQLESKEAHLEDITAQLTMEKESSEVMMVVTKSTLLEARSKIDEQVMVLMKEMQSKKNFIPVEDGETIKKVQHSEIESLKKVKEEILVWHEEQLARTKVELENVCGLLDRANEELARSCFELNEVEFELQIWKSVAENLKVNLEYSHRMRIEVEGSLLAQVAFEVDLREEYNSLVCSLEQKERRIDYLEQKLSTLFRGDEVEREIDWWEQEWVTKELESAILAQLESERIHEHEKKSLNQLVEEKDERINNLQEIMRSLEEEFDNSVASFSSQLAMMQGELDLFNEAWEKISTRVVLKEIEVQEKDLMIMELEKELVKQVEFEKKCLKSVRKLSREKENLMDIIGGVSERINKLSREDGQVMGPLKSIMLSFHENSAENKNVYHSPSSRKKIGNSLDDRSPLRSLYG